MKRQMPAKEQKRLGEFQQRMRKRPTKAESQFKKDVLKVLNGRYGIKSVSQKMIWEVKGKGDKKAYILDFYLPTLKLAIEIDGASHNSEHARTYDQIRDSLAAKKGIRVVRFSNDEVKDSENCIRKIYSEIERWQQDNLNRGRKATPVNREEELRVQQEFIERNGVKVLPVIGENRKPLRWSKNPVNRDYW